VMTRDLVLEANQLLGAKEAEIARLKLEIGRLNARLNSLSRCLDRTYFSCDVCGYARTSKMCLYCEARRWWFIRDYKIQMHSPKMNGTSGWRFRGGWPEMNGNTAEEAVDNAIAETTKEVSPK